MKTIQDFTGLYQLVKTLRFELRPIGKTNENIVKSGLLEQDEERAEKYKIVKKMIDEYHKAYIENALSDFKLKVDDEGGRDSLSEYFLYYKIAKKEEAQKKTFADIQAKLRRQIAEQFTASEAYKRIDKKELIKEDLLEFVKSEEDKALISEFSNFTTYFTGFHENRKNMYSDKEKSTAISFRLINENLPKFIDNMAVYDRLAQTEVAEKLPQLYSDLEEYLNMMQIEELFRLGYFNMTLTQTQIDVYNTVIGGKTLADGTKIKGLNEYVNLYNQRQTEKNTRLPKFKPLFKQILSDRVALSWLPDEFESDDDTLKSIKDYYQVLHKDVFNGNVEGEYSLSEILTNISDYQMDKIYISNDALLTHISKKMFGNWGEITRALEAQYKTQKKKTKRQSEEQYETIIAKKVKSVDSFSIGFIDECLQLVGKEQRVEEYFRTLGAVQTETENKPSLFALIEQAYHETETLLTTPYPKEKNLSQEKAEVEKIKNLLDAIKNLQYFVKPLLGKGNEPDKDEQFYGEFTALWEALDKITPLYNKVRNRMTRKPYSVEKFKLNFENSTLLDGWDLNKEPDNTSIIMRKNGLYFLGIMNKKHNKIFRPENIKTDGECFEKMEYKQVALPTGVGGFVRKCFNSAQRYGWDCPDYCLNSEGKIIIKDEEAKENLANIIDVYKNFFDKYEKDGFKYKDYNFKFSVSKSYEKLSDFFREVEHQGYKITFRNIAENYISQLVDEGKLYLFQIYNKDFSPLSKGAPNLHTLYWKMLFDENNLQDIVYKLNGQAEVFFRKSSINPQNRTVHKANQPIGNKNETTPQRKPSSVFEYDIIKDRRYTVDKFQFHVPITLNFKANDRIPTDKDKMQVFNYKINDRVNEFIKTNAIKHVIGIDRGERHLLYLTVVDMQGSIKEQLSLNEIVNNYNGNVYRTNYRDLLHKREEERDKERKSWKTIENIKDLKEGYLSQVIHKITQLVIQYNAIVVLEDLNFDFIRVRQKEEKQVYQKFEKMIIDKLNYFVNKTQKPNESNGLFKALQLSGVYNAESLKYQKQSGFIFYIPAWNTSKMDPVTGFVNLFDTRYENVEKAKSFFDKFNSIKFNANKDWFEFTFDYTNFTSKAEGTRTQWTLCTHGNRIESFRNAEKNSQWDSRELKLTQEFKSLFTKYNIDFKGNLKEDINAQTKKEFFEGLLYLLRLTLQMRNSVTGTDVDYLISPVMSSTGEFYDSRTCSSSLPQNADANGAYNIARKGIWVVHQIRQASDFGKLKLAISNREWLQFAQDKPYLE